MFVVWVDEILPSKYTWSLKFWFNANFSSVYFLDHIVIIKLVGDRIKMRGYIFLPSKCN